jgi:hypothetical protein
MGKKRRPTGPGRKPPADPRQHPIPGMLYRVRDKDWAELWGQSLSWADAEKLRDKLLVDGSSRTARVEASDMNVPSNLVNEARRAFERYNERSKSSGVHHVAGNYVPHQQIVEDAPLEPKPVLRSVPPNSPVPVTMGELADIEAEAIRREMPVDPQLAAVQSHALGVAGKEAARAQQRSDDALASAKRREQYKRERELAEKENERLQKEAEEMEKEFGDPADIPEGDLDDFLGGVGAMPTDAEIAEAKKKAQP